MAARKKPIRNVPPVERLAIELARVVAHESDERTFRRLASGLLRDAFNAGVLVCGVTDDGEFKISAYGANLRKHTTLRRHASRKSVRKTEAGNG